MHKFRLVVLGCASYAFMFGCATQKQRPTKKQGIALVSPEIINSSVGELLLPADSNVGYKGVFQESFPLGLPLSFGSGIRAHGIDPNTGDILLYGLSDRGPNSDSPLYIDSSSKEHASKIFLDPNYQPKIIRMKFNQTLGLTYVDALGIRTEAQAATGLPHPLGSKGATQEVALSDQLKVLGFDPLGIDPEGIDVDSHGSIWICEEYGPSLMKIDPQSGQIIEKYSPGQGLPEILSHRQPNRGFEGIAVSPNGRIYAALQSNLDIDGKTKKVADFIRIVEFDPETHKTRMFAYPIDRKEFSKFSEAKLGDILALDSQHLAVIEQGLSVNKTVLHRIQIIDLNNATDLSALKIEQGPMKGQELEFNSLAELSNQGIKALSLNLLIDLNKFNWTHEKAEGLARLDEHRLLITSDNDFALKAQMLGGESKDPGDFKVNDQTQILYNAQPSPAKISISPNPDVIRGSQWMIIEFKNLEFDKNGEKLSQPNSAISF